MKLNNFFNKESVTPSHKVSNVINVNNDYREAKLQTSIDELTQEIERLTIRDNEYSELRKKYFDLENQLSDTRASNDTLEEQELRLKQDVLYYETKMKDISNLEQSIREIQNESNKFRDNYYNARNVSHKQEDELDQLKNENGELDVSNKSLTIIAHAAEMENQALGEDFKQIKNQFEGIDKKYNDLSKIYIDAKRTVSTLKDEKAYWEKVAYSVQGQLEETTDLSTELKDWIAVVDKDKNKANAKASWGNTKIKELEAVITEMAHSLKDMVIDRDDVIKINNQLKYNLSKAGYATIGAIAKKEGFKMSLASSATNWNKNYLGTARPTLLKFKHREETHDHS